MTKSADQEHASPSSSFPANVFEGPAQVAIRTRTNDQPRYVDTRLKVWTWYDGGVALKIDWVKLALAPELTEIAKGFMTFSLEKYAPQTACMWTAPCTIDNFQPHNEALSKASGLTPPRWL